ncbi:lipopolysaccharide biosynthesis protein [Cumulibacter soli]|uniref:lipopolysaccharide biosynthesis protein n=1 Tax=Cumulibacter soli TaxID=2546344 RepID=UPI00106875BF|nr:oligosaccharide flippase family protein [Cumulibacter soli]
MGTLELATVPPSTRLGTLRALARRRGMESSALTLSMSTALTGVLGLVYWMIAERLFPTAEVGRASAVMSTATMLSSLSGLSLGGMYERFLADAGRYRSRFVLAGLGGTAALGLVVGGIFLLVGPTNTLFDDAAQQIAFPITVAVLTLYALLDSILTAIRRPEWVAAKNVLLSIAKILPLFLFAGWGGALAITGSWTVLAALAAGIATIAAARRLRQGSTAPPALPPTGELARHHVALVFLMAMGVVAPLVVPLIVISSEGPVAAAHFNIAWTLVSSVGLMLSTMMSAFVVEASAVPAGERHDLLRRMARVVGRMAVLCIGGLAVCGPLVLWLVGPAYLDAVGYLLFMVPALLLQQVISFFAALSRIAGRLRLLVPVQALGIIGIIGGSLLLVGPLGMTGVGVAIMSADLLCVLIIAVPLARLVRDGKVAQQLGARTGDESADSSA